MSEEAGQTILEHIEELRRRLFRALLALAAGALVSAVFAQQLLEWLARPVGGLENLEAIEVTENVGVFMQAVLLGGAILAMPVILYQLWQFISPGLLPYERRYVYLLVPFATVLFLSGVFFAYFVMLPAAIPFLLGFISIPTRPRPANYISFITNLMFWVGLSFETPLLVFFLAKVQVVDYRMLARNWRVALFLIAVLAAVVTPTPDPVNMGLVMLPLTLLYGLSILLARIAYRPPEE
ncbi:MAG TPA: twin-arginine translocase subunit TatC [Anaerolineales bacterium]|nr:twin-arginine translocase subunit TatC [Anaerolineae bacterium]HIQ02608.1 twin-arginine translocase subunit TatC [Anaerolineales bacterium]